MEKLDVSLSKIFALDKLVREEDAQIAKSPIYLARLSKMNSSATLQDDEGFQQNIQAFGKVF